MKLNLKEYIGVFKFFKTNIPLLLLGLYSISFINYYIYYKSFGIPIFNYVGLNDLLFFTIEYIFKIIAIIFLSEIFLYLIFIILFFGVYEKLIIIFIKKKSKLYFKSNKKNRARIDKIFYKYFDKGILNFRTTVVLFSMFIIPIFGHTLLLFPTFLIYIIYLLEKFSEGKMNNFTIIFFSGIIITFLTINTVVTTYNKRYTKDNHIISFKENSNFITTNKKISSFNYLGETSSNIFLYDIKKKETRIYLKSNITEFKIKNNNRIDKLILNIKANKIFRFFLKGMGIK